MSWISQRRYGAAMVLCGAFIAKASSFLIVELRCHFP